MSYYWLLCTAVFLAGVFFIRNLHIFFNVIYLKKPDSHLLRVSVSLFKRLKLYTWQFSPPDFFQGGTTNPSLQPDSDKDATSTEKHPPSPPANDHFPLYRHLLCKLAASLYFEKICLRLSYGFEDAALTGVSHGILAALRGVFLAVCGSYLRLKEEPDITFTPVYGRDRLEVEFNCIFSVRLGNVIAIAANALTDFCANTAKQWLNINIIRGGEARWRNILFKT